MGNTKNTDNQLVWSNTVPDFYLLQVARTLNSTFNMLFSSWASCSVYTIMNEGNTNKNVY